MSEARFDEMYAAFAERFIEAGLGAEALYELVTSAEPDEGIELLRMLLRERAGFEHLMKITDDALREAHSALRALKT